MKTHENNGPEIATAIIAVQFIILLHPVDDDVLIIISSEAPSDQTKNMQGKNCAQRESLIFCKGSRKMNFMGNGMRKIIKFHRVT